MIFTDHPEKRKCSGKLWISLISVVAFLCIGTVLFFVVRQFQNPKHRIGDEISWNLQLKEPICPTQGGPSVHKSYESAFLYNIVVEAEIVEILPDTYTQPTEILGGDLWEIVEMKTRDVVAGENIPESFYLMLPDGYSIGLAKYESFLLVIRQKGIAGDTFVNTQLCRYEQFYPTFTLRMSQEMIHDRIYNTVYNVCDPFAMLAFSDGYLDTSLWQRDGWDEVTWENILAADSEYPVKAGYSLAEAKQAILKFREENSQYIKPEYGKFFTADDYPTEEAAALFDKVGSLKNGTFLASGDYAGQGTYRRLVNGLPTNEYYTLNADGTVAEPNVVFTDADIAKCPDMATVINSATAEKPEWYQDTWITEVRAGYYKDGDEVFGYIRVTWNDKYTTVKTKNLIIHPDGTREDLSSYQFDQKLGR